METRQIYGGRLLQKMVGKKGSFSHSMDGESPRLKSSIEIIVHALVSIGSITESNPDTVF